jgi:hypothetical protein
MTGAARRRSKIEALVSGGVVVLGTIGFVISLSQGASVWLAVLCALVVALAIAMTGRRVMMLRRNREDGDV